MIVTVEIWSSGKVTVQFVSFRFWMTLTGDRSRVEVFVSITFSSVSVVSSVVKTSLSWTV